MAASIRKFCSTVNISSLFCPNGDAFKSKAFDIALVSKLCLKCIQSHFLHTRKRLFMTSVRHLRPAPLSFLTYYPKRAPAVLFGCKTGVNDILRMELFKSLMVYSPCGACAIRTIFYAVSLNTSKSSTTSQVSKQDMPPQNNFDSTKLVKEMHGCQTKNPGALEMKENIKTVPNLLTALRMASAPLLGYLVVCESFTWAFSIFVLAGITDLLDGFIARNFANQTSALGTALDPLADKLLVSVLTISMTSVGLIPVLLTALIVFRDVLLIAGGFYIRYRSLTPPITLSRYFDLSHATVKVSPTFISKLNTGLQLSLVALSLAAPVFGFIDHLVLQTLWYATGGTTFLSGAHYMWYWKNYVTLLEKDQKEL